MRQKGIILLVLWMSALTGFSQLPSTDLYLLDMKVNELKVLLENPILLSSFNMDGYNNQPSFLDDNHLLITSDWKAEGLTDIYQLNMQSKEISRITATAESEYSPTPSFEGDFIYVVRQEVTDSDTIPQILWKYPIDRSNFGMSVIDDITDIGYFKFISEDEVALFQVGPPNKLIIYDLRTNKRNFIALNIGRSLKYHPSSGFYYLQKIGNTAAIRLYDTVNKISKVVTYTPNGEVDFEVLTNGDLIIGEGAKILHYAPNGSRNWEPIIDLAPAGITEITRIAASRNKLAIVSRK